MNKPISISKLYMTDRDRFDKLWKAAQEEVEQAELLRKMEITAENIRSGGGE